MSPQKKVPRCSTNQLKEAEGTRARQMRLLLNASWDCVLTFAPLNDNKE